MQETLLSIINEVSIYEKGRAARCYKLSFLTLTNPKSGAPCVLFVFGVHVFFHVGKKTSHRSGEHFG